MKQSYNSILSMFVRSRISITGDDNLVSKHPLGADSASISVTTCAGQANTPCANQSMRALSGKAQW